MTPALPDSAPPDGVPSRRPRALLAARVVLAVLVGCLAAVIVHITRGGPEQVSDFDQIALAARALLLGENPYDAVARQGWAFPLLYPGPAVVLGLPSGWLSPVAARVAFAGVSGAVLAFALSRTPWRLLALTSASAIAAIVGGQWSPLFLAAWWLPAAGLVVAAKPNIGIAYLMAKRPSAVLYGAIGLTAASLALMPTWPMDWWHAVRSHNVAVMPVMRPGGVLLLLAALRAQRPEARLLLGLALMPQTTVLYETLLLFAIPRTWREMLALVVLSHVASYAQDVVAPLRPDGFEGLMAERWPILVALLYLPALLMVLRRPNVADDAVQPQPLARAA